MLLLALLSPSPLSSPENTPFHAHNAARPTSRDAWAERVPPRTSLHPRSLRKKQQEAAAAAVAAATDDDDDDDDDADDDNRE